MKIIIAGSRTLKPGFGEMGCAVAALCPLHAVKEIVCGMAKGVDLQGLEWARAENIFVAKFPANWEKGRGAGFERNEKMGEYADGLVAFWDGESRGTAHMIKVMQRLKKPFVVVCNYSH